MGWTITQRQNQQKKKEKEMDSGYIDIYECRDVQTSLDYIHETSAGGRFIHWSKPVEDR